MKERGWNRLQLGIFVHFCSWLDQDPVEAFDKWKSKIVGKDPWASLTNSTAKGRSVLKRQIKLVGPESEFAAKNLAFLKGLPVNFV